MKKYIEILLTGIMIFVFAACGSGNEDNATENVSFTETTQVETTTEVTTQPTTEAETEVQIPSIDELSNEQKELLPFYNNGFGLDRGVRDIYYMGKLIATDVPIYADGKYYYWTITNDYIVYFRGTMEYQNEGKKLMTYDLRTGETNTLRDWEELEKYGDYGFFMSDGINVFLVFHAGQSYNSWFNIVKIDENGNDTLICKTTYGSEDSNIRYGSLYSAINLGEENIFYTIGKYDDHDDEYFVKVKIDFKTGEYEVVDKEEGVIGGKGKVNANGDSYWSEQYQLLDDKMYFLPSNVFYYGDTRQEVDELNGKISTVTDIVSVDRKTRKEKIICTIDEKYIDETFITDKYLILWGNVIDLENGEMTDLGTYYTENETDSFFEMCLYYYGIDPYEVYTE